MDDGVFVDVVVDVPVCTGVPVTGGEAVIEGEAPKDTEAVASEVPVDVGVLAARNGDTGGKATPRKAVLASAVAITVDTAVTVFNEIMLEGVVMYRVKTPASTRPATLYTRSVIG